RSRGVDIDSAGARTDQMSQRGCSVAVRRTNSITNVAEKASSTEPSPLHWLSSSRSSLHRCSSSLRGGDQVLQCRPGLGPPAGLETTVGVHPEPFVAKRRDGP